MADTLLLRQLVSERLSAAVEDICGLFEKTMAEHQDEANREICLLKQQLQKLTETNPQGAPEECKLHGYDQPLSKHKPHFRQPRGRAGSQPVEDAQAGPEDLLPPLQQYDDEVDEITVSEDTERCPRVKEEQLDQSISPSRRADFSNTSEVKLYKSEPETNCELSLLHNNSSVSVNGEDKGSGCDGSLSLPQRHIVEDSEELPQEKSDYFFGMDFECIREVQRSLPELKYSKLMAADQYLATEVGVTKSKDLINIVEEDFQDHLTAAQCYDAVQTFRQKVGQTLGSEEMLVCVTYNQQHKFIKLDEVEGHFDFLQFHDKVIERFRLPSGAKVVYKDSTETEVDADTFSDVIEQGCVVLSVFCDYDFSSTSKTSASISNSSAPNIIEDVVPHKRRKTEDTFDAASARQLIEAVLRNNSRGGAVLQEYQAKGTLTDATRRQMVNILVAHMVDKHGHVPPKPTREKYALGIVMLFPSLMDPYSKKGYEHFYDAASGTGYISWRLKTVQRKIRRGYDPPVKPVNFSPGGPNVRRAVHVDRQLDGDACQEAMSLLKHTTDKSLIFQKMRETFKYRQKVLDQGRCADVLLTFPRFLDTKGLVDQDFMLLFDEDTSSNLLQKWDVFFKPNIISEAKRLTVTPELQCLLESAEGWNEPCEATTYDQEMASMLLLLHLLPPSSGGQRFPKISASDATERLVVFHKPQSYCNLEHLHSRSSHHPYLLAVGRQRSAIDSFYIKMDKHLIPCKAKHALAAFDELFKAHFVFNLSYDAALVNFYTFLQTTVYNIDVGKMKESPRVRELRARLLNQTLQPSLYKKLKRC